MKEFLAFLESHPTLTGLFIVPVLTAPVTWLLKPRTPEEFRAMPPLLARLLKLIAGFGFDARKVSEALREILLHGNRPLDADRVLPEKLNDETHP